MSEKTEKTIKTRNKDDSTLPGKYTNMTQSLLDIWNMLVSAKDPLTAGEIGKHLKERSTSAQTAERRMADSVNALHNLFPQANICQENIPSIRMTYSHDNTLHVVLEPPTGEDAFWFIPTSANGKQISFFPPWNVWLPVSVIGSI